MKLALLSCLMLVACGPEKVTGQWSVTIKKLATTPPLGCKQAAGESTTTLDFSPEGELRPAAGDTAVCTTIYIDGDSLKADCTRQTGFTLTTLELTSYEKNGRPAVIGNLTQAGSSDPDCSKLIYSVEGTR